MRKQLAHTTLVLLAVAGLAACTPDGTPSAPSPTTTAASPGPTGTASASPSPDVETTDPAPSPSAAPLPSGPGEGNAELAIIIKSSETGTATSYTLVCQGGAPADESKHPDAAAACTALKNNPAILTPVTPPDQACTQQYGGPEEATVTGVVDGVSVETSFSKRDGCEITAWDAAQAVLGSSGGAG